LADDTRDDIEPFVGHDEDIGEVAQLVGQRRAAGPRNQPTRRGRSAGRSTTSTPSRGRSGRWECNAPMSSTTASTDVNDAGELEQVGVVPDRLREGRPEVDGRGGEVSRRHLPAIEPARP
jgi:hypothetical protein